MKIVTIVGARPQFIKAATLSRIIRTKSSIREVLLHTGQHYDDNMSNLFFRELDIPDPDYNLGVGSGSHATQTAGMLTGIEEVLLKERPDFALVYGDTNSTLAGALTASKMHIPVAHVEAGLRSLNRAMPEELNRIVTDHLSDILFAPTLTAINNLEAEGLKEKTHFTGDVMYDSVLFYQKRITVEPEKYRMEGTPAEFLLATLHRAENTDNPENLENILLAFGKIGIEVVLPVHPRTVKTLRSSFRSPPNLRMIEPVGYLQMMKLIMDAKKVLTDSGGLQKEAYFLAKQCITLRMETEWVETLHDGWNILAGCDPEKIRLAVESPVPTSPQRHDFGDGKSAEQILEKLLTF